MGAHAARPRPEGRRRRLESAWLGAIDRQDSARPAAAGRVAPPGQAQFRLGTAGRRRIPVSVVDALDAVAAETGKTVPQVALNWLLQRPTVATIVIGARNEEQLRQNLGSVGWNLTPEQVARLDAASAVTPIYPSWHQKGFVERNPFPTA